MKVILTGPDKILEQARVAYGVMEKYPKGKPAGTITGWVVYDEVYGVKWNKNSITIQPQAKT